MTSPPSPPSTPGRKVRPLLLLRRLLSLLIFLLRVRLLLRRLLSLLIFLLRVRLLLRRLLSLLIFLLRVRLLLRRLLSLLIFLLRLRPTAAAPRWQSCPRTGFAQCATPRSLLMPRSAPSALPTSVVGGSARCAMGLSLGLRTYACSVTVPLRGSRLVLAKF
jgi:hypothetical protein